LPLLHSGGSWLLLAYSSLSPISLHLHAASAVSLYLYVSNPSIHSLLHNIHCT
jgi:hypothetical protein